MGKSEKGGKTIRQICKELCGKQKLTPIYQSIAQQPCSTSKEPRARERH